MPRLLALLLLLLLLLVTGCTHGVERGSSVITIHAADLEEEDAIRAQLWRVERAVQTVVVAYGIEHLATEVFVQDLGGLGQTTPDLDHTAHVFGGRVAINKRLLTDPPEDLDATLLGLFAHELAHALHYDAMSTADLLIFGERYLAFYNNPEGNRKGWARAYERFTDLTAIAHGFAVPLAAQKRASAHNIEKQHPAKVWTFYLTEPEIETLAADDAMLADQIDAYLDQIGLASLRAWSDRSLKPLVN